MNAVPYIAPFALFDLDAAAFSEAEWKACRKKILAEFELSGNATITWKGRSFDKSTLLQLLEEVHEPEARAFHVAVQNDALLYRFLLHFDPLILEDKTTGHDPQLLRQCAAYLAYACGQAVCMAFCSGNITAVLTAVSGKHPFLLPAVVPHLWNPLIAYLQQTNQVPKQFQKENVQTEEAYRLYEKYLLPVFSACMLVLPPHVKPACEVYVRHLVHITWMLPHSPKQAAWVCTAVTKMSDVVPSGATHTRSEIGLLYNRLAAAELLPFNRSRRLLVASFLPVLLLLITSIVFVSGGNNMDTLTPGVKRIVSNGAMLSAIVTLGFLVAAFRYTWRNRNTITGWWFFGLLMLNVLVFPLFWFFFIRHPKDRAGNILSIVLIGITLALVFVRGAMEG